MSLLHPTGDVGEQPLDQTAGDLLRVSGLGQRFRVRTSARHSKAVWIVEGISFHIGRAESVALVGESGSGKTTIVRALLQSPPPTVGSVVFNGQELSGGRRSTPGKGTLGIQAIFQDPFGSVDPTWTVGRIVAEPIARRLPKAEVVERVDWALDQVGLNPRIMTPRRPRELSGGQCQRVAIARAVVADPELIVCDEPVASLDVSVQAQVLNVFTELRRKTSLGYLFVTHDLNVAHYISDRVVVVYLGKVCEIGRSDDVWRDPGHPYTQALLEASPSIGRRESGKTGGGKDWPSVLNPPSGCRFRTRCKYATERCSAEEPELRDLGGGRAVACHFPLATVAGGEQGVSKES